MLCMQAKPCFLCFDLQTPVLNAGLSVSRQPSEVSRAKGHSKQRQGKYTGDLRPTTQHCRPSFMLSKVPMMKIAVSTCGQCCAALYISYVRCKEVDLQYQMIG